MQLISEEALQRRKYWVLEIAQLSGNFGVDSSKVQDLLSAEIKAGGAEVIIDHLRLCGSIPESYGHDSSEEKLYSKYTDIVLAEAYVALGLKSLVLTGRSNVADVEAFATAYNFVADAKVFRLSRTAKNQKDFKVQAMDNWKHGKPYAMIVAPLYQYPSRTSQIYQQASARNVCIFSYSHLSFLVRFCMKEGSAKTIALLHRLFRTVETLNPSQHAFAYWQAINSVLITSNNIAQDLWRDEKVAHLESITAAKTEALDYLSNERTKIMNLSHADALIRLLRTSKIENKMSVITKIHDNGLFEITN